MAAFQVAYEGFLNRTPRFIPRAAIHLIGGDIESPVAKSSTVSREAIVDISSDEHPMVVDLEKAEREDFQFKR